ncbi:hypothetical protein Tco_0045731 [Tanacetum coccineum]
MGEGYRISLDLIISLTSHILSDMWRCVGTRMVMYGANGLYVDSTCDTFIVTYFGAKRIIGIIEREGLTSDTVILCGSYCMIGARSDSSGIGRDLKCLGGVEVDDLRFVRAVDVISMGETLVSLSRIEAVEDEMDTHSTMSHDVIRGLGSLGLLVWILQVYSWDSAVTGQRRVYGGRGVRGLDGRSISVRSLTETREVVVECGDGVNKKTKIQGDYFGDDLREEYSYLVVITEWLVVGGPSGDLKKFLRGVLRLRGCDWELGGDSGGTRHTTSRLNTTRQCGEESGVGGYSGTVSGCRQDKEYGVGYKVVEWRVTIDGVSLGDTTGVSGHREKGHTEAERGAHWRDGGESTYNGDSLVNERKGVRYAGTGHGGGGRCFDEQRTRGYNRADRESGCGRRLVSVGVLSHTDSVNWGSEMEMGGRLQCFWYTRSTERILVYHDSDTHTSRVWDKSIISCGGAVRACVYLTWSGVGRFLWSEWGSGLDLGGEGTVSNSVIGIGAQGLWVGDEYLSHTVSHRVVDVECVVASWNSHRAEEGTVVGISHRGDTCILGGSRGWGIGCIILSEDMGCYMTCVEACEAREEEFLRLSRDSRG